MVDVRSPQQEPVSTMEYSDAPTPQALEEPTPGGPWRATSALLALTVIGLLAALGLQWTANKDLEANVSPLQSEIERREGQVAELSAERDTLASDNLRLEGELAALSAEAAPLGDLRAAVEACERTATIGQEFTASLEEYRAMESAWWQTEEGSQEEHDLGMALEVAMSGLRDMGADLKRAADGCLAATSTATSL